MNGNNSRTIWRKRNETRKKKKNVGVRRQKAAGSRKTPIETPTDGTKIGAEVVKPRLKNRSVFEKTPVGVVDNRSVVWKPRGGGFKTPNAKVEQ